MRNVLTIFQAENKDILDQVFMTEVVKMVDYEYIFKV